MTGPASPGTGARPVPPASPGTGARPVPPASPAEYADLVLDLADRIPAGRVMSYGDIAEYLGTGGPRQVGRVMALWGGAVAWWRVVHADGSFLRGHEADALARYAAERTPLRRAPDGAPMRVDMSRARWAPEPG